MNRFIKIIIFPAVIFFISLFFISPFLLGSTIPYVGDFTGSDLTELNLPFRYFSSEAIKNGHLPLWTNLLSNGFQVLAEGQAGVFYPINLLIFTLLPFWLAVNVGFLINFTLAGWFSYLYFRILKISQYGSLFAALAFSFSGFFIFRLKHLNMINAAIWLPLIFYLIEKYFITRKKGLVVALLGLVFSIQFFAGHPQIFYISMLSSLIYVLIRVLLYYGFNLKIIFKNIVLPWIAICTIVIGLVSVQLLPTLSHVDSSGRGDNFNYDQVASYPYTFSSLLDYVYPYFFGNPANNTASNDLQSSGVFWESNAYFGFLSLLLALFASIFLFRKEKRIGFLILLIAIFYVFIFGSKTSLFLVFWKIIPGFDLFRFPQRFLLPTLLCLTALAGFGFDYILSKIKNKNKSSQYYLLFNYFLPVLFILILLVDLFLVSYKYIGALDYKKYFSLPDSALKIQKDTDYYRIYSMDWPSVWQLANQLSDGWQNNLSFFIATRELMPPDLNIFWNIPSAQERGSAEGGVLPREIQAVNSLLASRIWNNNQTGDRINVSMEDLNVLSLKNVKYLLSYKSLVNSNLKLLDEVEKDYLPPLKIYENKLFLPEVRGVFEVVSVGDKNEALQKIFSDFDPLFQVVLEDGQAAQLGMKNGSANILGIRRDFNFLEVEADFSQPGYLVLSQAYAPGWQVMIDDKRSELLRANYAFSAVAVPSGHHRISLVYRPWELVVGLFISLISFSALFVYLVVYLIFSYRKSKVQIINQNNN